MHYNADNKSFHHHLHPLYVVSVNSLHNVYNNRNTRQYLVSRKRVNSQRFLRQRIPLLIELLLADGSQESQVLVLVVNTSLAAKLDEVLIAHIRGDSLGQCSGLVGL